MNKDTQYSTDDKASGDKGQNAAAIASNDMGQTANAMGRNVKQGMSQLAEDAKALFAATADVAGDKVKEARKRLGEALERAKDMGNDLRDQAVKGAKLADKAIRENPYPAIAAGVGVGAIIGILLARR